MTEVGLWVAVATGAVLWLAILVSRTRPRLPPGPRGWPIFGSMFSLGSLPHAALYELSKQYGPLMHLRIGNVKTLVVTSPQIAQEILKTQDQIMSGRPVPITGKIFSYGGLDIGFSPPGEYWKQMRNLMTLELLTPKRLKQFQELREQEAVASLHYILEESQRGNFVDMGECFATITMNNLCQIVMRKNFSFRASGSTSTVPGSIYELLTSFVDVLGAFNIADFVPLLKPFDPQGLSRKSKNYHVRLDKFLEQVIEEHRQRLSDITAENCTEDFVHALLKMKQNKDLKDMISMDSIKAILLDTLAAGGDTSTGTALWAIVELIRHPHVMKKAQEELDSVVGTNRLVQEEDLPKLKYIDAVIKETYRLHPAATLLVPHLATQDCEIQGFHISAKTQIFVNVWGIQRDPAVWERPLEFDPDRFLNSNVDFKGRDFNLLPFGSGRRMCPGQPLASLMVLYMVAFLVHALDFSLPEGQKAEELDVSEKFGASTKRKLPLKVSGIARLPKDVVYPAQKVHNKV